MENLPSQIPDSLYLIVGVMVVTNLSSLGALVVFIFKCGKFVSNTENGIEKAQSAAIRAHKRIDKLEGNEAHET